MPLRQIQVHLPTARSGDFAALLDELAIEALWQEEDYRQNAFMALVVLRAYETDSFLQALMDRFGHEDQFRLVLFEIAAIYPPTEEPEEKADDDSPTDDGEPAAEPTEESNPKRVAIEELEERLRWDSKLSSSFVITVLLSALVAALGLMKDNPAVVIGAMVIAPLLSPNMTLALGTTLGNVRLIREALTSNLAGLGLTLSFAILIGLFFPFDHDSREITSRTVVSYSDVLLALASGVAGAIAVTSGISAALVGVMVAVALMPPLVVSGLLLGTGEWALAQHAILLTAINVIAVNLAAVGTFTLRDIRPRNYWDSGKATRMTRGALLLWASLLGLFTVLVWLAGTF